ncbi:uncharacterized protein JCM15063_003155 [Sporobolomyces koalae]|uniref:uncharacterized protein n=1 Tax=Sporobolomyces koalae TaxID=500713 RepID=UPI00317E931F
MAYRSIALLSAATTFASCALAASSSSASSSAPAHTHASPASASNAAATTTRATTTTAAPATTAATSTQAAASPAAPSGAVDRTTWQGEEKILDPNVECSYYSYPPVTNILSSYPDIWVTADLSNAGITQFDRDFFASINSSIPNIAPRGTRAGNFDGVTYDSNADPDCWWTDSRCTQPKLAGLDADVTKCLEPNSWGFTLDDGPNCSHNAYYDYLQTINQKATLFYIGSNVLDWPLEAQRGLADGHEICSHTWSHPYMTSMTNEQAFAELYYSKKAIKDILGITVRCWRPPYGDVDDRIRFIAKALDMETIVWSDDTFDYDWYINGRDAVRANYDAILAKQANGTYDQEGIVVLTHEIDGVTMEISQEYLPKMQAQFSGGVVPVGVCRNISQPYVETADFVYPNYKQYMAGTRSITLAAPTANPGNGNELVFHPTTTSPLATATSSASQLAQSLAADPSHSSSTHSSAGAKSSSDSKKSSAAAIQVGSVLGAIVVAVSAFSLI